MRRNASNTAALSLSSMVNTCDDAGITISAQLDSTTTAAAAAEFVQASRPCRFCVVLQLRWRRGMQENEVMAVGADETGRIVHLHSLDDAVVGSPRLF